LIKESGAIGNTLTIADPHISGSFEEVLRKDGFKRQASYWTKYTIPVAATTNVFIQKIRSMGDIHDRKVLRNLRHLIASDAEAAQKIERAYWPLKIVDSAMPTYIVPIQPHWAAELFDDELANQDLFGARTRLSLNREGVYYRSAKVFGGLAAPARILWYVSEDDKFVGSKSIRACSFLDAVVLGSPKELFRRFERLGVYEWKHMTELARWNVDTSIMAIRYSDTQLLPNPIAWRAFQPILREAGVKTQLQSPQLIPPQVFSKIYLQGTKKRNES
jgi:hypothetical protein